MKFADLKEMSLQELGKKKKTLVQELVLNKMKNSIGQLENPLQIRTLRKSIAKIDTALTEKLSK
jgi:large subunit ribosomal protein L29